MLDRLGNSQGIGGDFSMCVDFSGSISEIALRNWQAKE